MIYSQYWIEAGLPKSSKFFNVEMSDLKGDINKVVEKVLKWDYENPVCVTFLSENAGVGKTHLAVCLMKKYIVDKIKATSVTGGIGSLAEQNEQQQEFERQFTRIKIIKEPFFYYRLQSTYQKEAIETEEDVMNYFCELDFLVIDDLFSTKENEFARSKMLTLIDMRIDWLNKPTVLTSNKSLDYINKNIDSRIASRINNDMLFKIELTKDYRKE